MLLRSLVRRNSLKGSSVMARRIKLSRFLEWSDEDERDNVEERENIADESEDSYDSGTIPDCITCDKVLSGVIDDEPPIRSKKCKSSVIKKPTKLRKCVSLSTTPSEAKSQPRLLFHSEPIHSHTKTCNFPNSKKPDTPILLRTKKDNCARKLQLGETTDEYNNDQPVVNVLQNISNQLGTLVKRLEKTESKLELMEQKLETTSSVSRKEVVPPVVRAETRKTYRALLDSDWDFAGFDTSPETNYHNPCNRAITDLLLKEVHGNNPTFLATDIRAAAYTYYRSVCQEKALKWSGKYGQQKIQRRRRERVVRRLNKRESQFKKLSYSESDQNKWKKVLKYEMISSDKSGSKSVFIVKELPWRSEKVTSFFNKLDEMYDSQKSEQASCQTKRRVRIGKLSMRPMPPNLGSQSLTFISLIILHHSFIRVMIF